MPLSETRYRGSLAYFEAYRVLIHAARDKRFLTYKPLIEILKLKRGNYAQSQVGKLLGEISEDAYHAGLPLLTAIVVNQSTHRPGAGFFELAQTLGKLPAGPSEQQRQNFWESEVQRVYNCNWPPSATELRRIQ